MLLAKYSDRYRDYIQDLISGNFNTIYPKKQIYAEDNSG